MAEKAYEYDVELIYNYLRLGLTNEEIEELIGSSCSLISRIRNGKSYRRNDEIYPIYSRYQQTRISQYGTILYLLENTSLPLYSIALSVGVSRGTVYKIYHKHFPPLLSENFGVDFTFLDRNRADKTKHVDKVEEKSVCAGCNAFFVPRNPNQKYCSRLCRGKEESKCSITRETLKKEIRFNNFKELGKRYEVSDNTVRKWCRRYNLPDKAKVIRKYTDEEWEEEIWCDSQNRRNEIISIPYDYEHILQEFCILRDKRLVESNIEQPSILSYAIEKHNLHLPTVSYCHTSCHLKERNLYFRSAEDAGKWLLENTENQYKTHTYFSKKIAKAFKTNTPATLTLPDPSTGSSITLIFTHIPEEEFYSIIQHHHIVSYAFDPKWRAIVEDPSLLPDFVSLDDLPWVDEFKKFYGMD